MTLGNSLFHARKKCGLSQEDVAEKLGVSRQTVSKWETNYINPHGFEINAGENVCTGVDPRYTSISPISSSSCIAVLTLLFCVK